VGVRGRSPLLGEGIRGSVRLGRLGIGMISKSAIEDGTLIVHQCRKVFFVKLSLSFNQTFNTLGPKIEQTKCTGICVSPVYCFYSNLVLPFEVLTLLSLAHLFLFSL
jgi:hypothetical protein